MKSFEKFTEKKLPDKEQFYSSVEDKTPGNNGKKLDDQISDKNYLACKKVSNKFNMKNIDDCQDHYHYVFERFIDMCLKFF